jgi:hypothetical protein
MSTFLFGATSTLVYTATAKRLHAICIAEGGTGFVRFAQRGAHTKGWFTAAGNGEPFATAIKNDVLERVRRELPQTAIACGWADASDYDDDMGLLPADERADREDYARRFDGVGGC